MRRITSFLIGTLIGGMVGASLAILLAPESGENLRQELRQRADAFASEVRSAAEARKIELQQQLEALRSPTAE